MRKFFPLVLMLALLCPCASVFTTLPAAQARVVAHETGKLTKTLRARVRRTKEDSNERARVIVNLARGTETATARRSLERAGVHVQQQFDQLGVVVADVPTAQLETLAAHNEVAWVSEDAEAGSLATTPGNTSHIEVTTGANLVLPSGNDNEAKGGAGNGVGIALLDSGLNPPDTAAFAGYELQSSSLLGTGLLGSTSVTSYNRVSAPVDFTGENRTDDPYGHGTHTAGVAAGTGQSSEDYAAQHAGAPTYGGIATGANLVSVRVLNSLGIGTVSNVIAGINWVIKNKSTYNIRVMNLSRSEEHTS